MPDLETPMKIAVRGLPESFIPDNIQNEFKEKGFNDSKVPQTLSHKIGRMLILFFLHFQNPTRIFGLIIYSKLESILNIIGLLEWSRNLLTTNAFFMLQNTIT